MSERQVVGACEHRSGVATGEGEIALIGQPGGKKRLRYAVVDDQALFEGDILLTNRPLEELGVAISDPRARWPGGVIPYDFAADLPNRDRVKAAIAHWEQHTPIRFRRRTNERDYVIFRSGGGCASAVGLLGGVQFIQLGALCTIGNAIHEIGHTVGLWHEQSREDRDDFVEINHANIDPDLLHNFDQHIADGDDIGPYDYGSIMHYPANAFALDPALPTLVARGGQAIGQRNGLSAGDIASVKAMYPGT